MSEREGSAWASPAAVVRALPFMASCPPVRNLVLTAFEERTYRFGETVSAPEDGASSSSSRARCGGRRRRRTHGGLARRARPRAVERRAGARRGARRPRSRSAPPRAPCACCGSTAPSRSLSRAPIPRPRRRFSEQAHAKRHRRVPAHGRDVPTARRGGRRADRQPRPDVEARRRRHRRARGRAHCIAGGSSSPAGCRAHRARDRPARRALPARGRRFGEVGALEAGRA